MNSKLNKTFKINPLYEADSYKVGHKAMLIEGIEFEAWNWIPRSLKYMHPSINKIMSGGSQFSVRYLHSTFQEFFFDEPVEVALKFISDMSKHLGVEFEGSHFIELHKLGYLPIRIQALPEGTFTNPNIPHIQGINTVKGYAWLGLYLETIFSKISWQFSTTATIGHKFKQNALASVTKTDPENLFLANYMCHDFHSRGGNPFTSVVVGLAHSFSNHGGDTLNTIPASRYYYDAGEDEMLINSVNASEHSVTSAGIFYYENMLRSGEAPDEIVNYYMFDAPSEGSIENPDYRAIAELMNMRTWLEKFPTGILSYVADTFDLWKLINFILPRLKEKILARDGKLVLRPDSGDPVAIITGYLDYLDVEKHELDDFLDANKEQESAARGVVELLWDIFGGEITSTGYKRLDSHIGAIYGDSINLDRQVQIYDRLESKGFASTNTVLGIGSFTYVYITRDQAGYAAKGSWFKMDDGSTYNIYKDPITDDGTKKSLKGFQFVYKDKDGVIQTEGEVSEEKAFADYNMLKVIYEDGKFYNQTTISEIRKKLS